MPEGRATATVGNTEAHDPRQKEERERKREGWTRQRSVLHVPVRDSSHTHLYTKIMRQTLRQGLGVAAHLGSDKRKYK